MSLSHGFGPVLGVALVVAFAALPALATFDGENGRIAYSALVPVGPGEFTANAIFDGDGSQLTSPTLGAANDTDPAY